MMKFSKHYLVYFFGLISVFATQSYALELYVNTTDIASAKDTLDIYDLPEGDSGYGGEGPGGTSLGLARSGFYQVDLGLVNQFSTVDSLLSEEALNPGGELDLVEALRLVTACASVLSACADNIIYLQEDGIYEVSVPDNFWFGPNALPPIQGRVTIVGNGATIKYTGVNPARLFYNSNFGVLTLRDLTLEGGLAQGGDGSQGTTINGGGGAGLGGGIYNRGLLSIEGVTFSGNEARGGSAGTVLTSGVSYGAGGGLGGDADAITGGGFFNTGFLGGEQADGFEGGISSAGGGAGQDGVDGGGGGGAFGGGGTLGDPAGQGGLGGGFTASDVAGENGGGWKVSATISGGAGGFGGGGGPGATGGFGGGSGGGQSEAAFGGGAENQGGAAYGGAIFNHAGELRIKNTTFSGNRVVSGDDAAGAGQTNIAEGAGVFSLNSFADTNSIAHNTFFKNECVPDSCEGASLAVKLDFSKGLGKQPGQNTEEGFEKTFVESGYRIYGNILDAQAAASQPMVVMTNEPLAEAETEKLNLLIDATNNLLPVGKSIRLSSSGAPADITWENDPVGCLESTAVLRTCGPGPFARSPLGLSSDLDRSNGGLTPVHWPDTPVAATKLYLGANNFSESIILDQRGAKRLCDIAGDVQVGSVQNRTACGDTPLLVITTGNTLLNEPSVNFVRFEVSDAEVESSPMTLTMALTNVSSIDLPANLNGVTPSADNTTLEGRRSSLQRVMESAGFTVLDMSEDTASITFTLTNGDTGLSTTQTVTVDLDNKPPVLAVPELPSQITSRDSFTVTVRVDEPVGGLDVSKVQVVNGEALKATNVSPTEYELTLSANGGSDGEESMFFQFLAGAVTDNAGNDSERSSEPYRVSVDLPEGEEDLDGRSGGGGGSAALGPLGLVLLLAGALRFRRNGL